MKFNILLGNHPAQAINTTRDHTLIIRGGLEEAGHFAQLSFDQFFPGEVNLFYDFISSENLPMFRALKQGGHAYGLITTEILKDGKMNHNETDWFRDRIAATREVAQNAQFVWVMHEPSMASYRELCGHERCYYLPLGYSKPAHELRHVPYADRDIDFMFFGMPTAHRKAVLEKFRGTAFNVQLVYNLPGFIRNSLVERTKINISLRQTPTWDQPSAGRISYLVSNHCAVVVEQTANGRPYEDYVVAVSTEQFAQTCMEMISNNSYQAAAEQRAEDFRRDFPMKLLMERLLEQTFAGS
jgi:hypothetical protein